MVHCRKLPELSREEADHIMDEVARIAIGSLPSKDKIITIRTILREAGLIAKIYEAPTAPTTTITVQNSKRLKQAVKQATGKNCKTCCEHGTRLAVKLLSVMLASLQMALLRNKRRRLNTT